MVKYQEYINEAITSIFKTGTTVRCKKLPGRTKAIDIIGKITKVLDDNDGFGPSYKINFYKDREFLADHNSLIEIYSDNVKLKTFEPDRAVNGTYSRKYKIGDLVKIDLHHYRSFGGLSAVVEWSHPSKDKMTYEYTVKFIDFMGRAIVSEDEMNHQDKIEETTKQKGNLKNFKSGDYVRYVNMNKSMIYMEIFGKITQIHLNNDPVTYRIRFYEQREMNVSGSDVFLVNPVTDELYDFNREYVTIDLNMYKYKLGDNVIVNTRSLGNKIFNGLKATIESRHPLFNNSYQYTIRFNDFKGRMRISEWELSEDNSKKDNKEKMSSTNYKFSINDRVRYIDKNRRYPEYNKYIGVVKSAFPNEDGYINSGFNEYSVTFSKTMTILAMEEELESVSSGSTLDIETSNNITGKINASDNKLANSVDRTTKSYPEYIESQFPNKPKGEIKVGSKVIINGKDDKIDYDKVIGIIRKITPDDYFIHIQEDESKNRTSYYAHVPMELVTLIETPKDKFENGDQVVCVDDTSDYYKQTGVITKHWEKDNSYMVQFKEDEVWVTFDDIKHPDDVSFPVEKEKRKIGFNLPATRPPEVPIKQAVEEEEEEEEPESNKIKRGEAFKKDDLLEFSYEDFFTDKEKISDLEDIKALKTKFQGMKSGNNSKIKAIFAEKAFQNLEIIESYFGFLANKVAKDIPVLRINDVVDDTDLLSTKTKVRASDNKELTNKYSFDQGIVAYWKFKDAVVFKTL